jgi:hypothetical protein
MVIEFVDNDTNGWIEIDVSGLAPKRDSSEIPFRAIGNRFKSSSADCELFIHQPVAMLLREQDESPDPKVRELLKSVLEDVTPATRTTTFIVNHEETLSNFHLYAVVYSGHGSERTLAIVMWKLGDDSGEEGAVTRVALEHNLGLAKADAARQNG